MDYRLDLLIDLLVLNVDSNLNCLHVVTSLIRRFSAITAFRFVLRDLLRSINSVVVVVVVVVVAGSGACGKVSEPAG